jgi:hypothetical protein
VRLEALGIGTGIYHPSVGYDFERFRRHPRVVVKSTSVAEQVAREVLSLPVHMVARRGARTGGARTLNMMRRQTIYLSSRSS